MSSDSRRLSCVTSTHSNDDYVNDNNTSGRSRDDEKKHVMSSAGRRLSGVAEVTRDGQSADQHRVYREGMCTYG